MVSGCSHPCPTGGWPLSAQGVTNPPLECFLRRPGPAAGSLGYPLAFLAGAQFQVLTPAPEGAFSCVWSLSRCRSLSARPLWEPALLPVPAAGPGQRVVPVISVLRVLELTGLWALFLCTPGRPAQELWQ